MIFCAKVCPDLAKIDIFKETEWLTLVAIRAVMTFMGKLLHIINLYPYIHIFHTIDYDSMPESTLFMPNQLALLQTRNAYFDSKRAYLVQGPPTLFYNKSCRK